MRPIPVRVQRQNETFEAAKRLLLKAIGKNDFKQALLLKTNETEELSLFGTREDVTDPVIIVDDIKLIPQIKIQLAALI